MAYWYRRLKKVVRPLAWSGREWFWFLRFFSQSWALFVTAKLGYRRLRPRVVRALAAPIGPMDQRAQPLLRAFQRVYRWTWVPRNCLREALILHEALASQQVFTRLIIGVAKNDQFRAHAWLVHQDGPLLQDAAQLTEYVTFQGDFSQWMA